MFKNMAERLRRTSRITRFTIAAGLAVVVAAIAILTATSGSSSAPAHHAGRPPMSAAHNESVRPAASPEPLSEQLRSLGYTFDPANDYRSAYSTDSHRMIYTQVWHSNGILGTPDTVYLTDAAKSGTFVIDNVSYDKVLNFNEFWCVPPTQQAASNADTTIAAATQELHAAQNLSITLEFVAAPGNTGATIEIDGYTTCYMN